MSNEQEKEDQQTEGQPEKKFRPVKYLLIGAVITAVNGILGLRSIEKTLTGKGDLLGSINASLQLASARLGLIVSIPIGAVLFACIHWLLGLFYAKTQGETLSSRMLSPVYAIIWWASIGLAPTGAFYITSLVLSVVLGVPFEVTSLSFLDLFENFGF